MANDWDSVEDFFTDEFTTDIVYSGYTLSGLLYVSQADRQAIAAGLQAEYTQRLMLRVSDCDDIGWTPAPDDSVTIEGTARYIETAEKDSTRKCWIIEINEATARG